ncbi:hypothetical protein [Roseobacter weihaiensis]|uniref:hypothetical protein n=1 Tax=Roseobacter weihaiensis TaxID=2763262 RepID=UPI001D0A2473|nr:hypothetical protein [Roseobacter sp. H9]
MSFAFDLGSFVAALIVVMGGALAYWNQKRIDRQHELTLKRRELYYEFVGSLVDAANGDTDPHLRSRVRAIVLASDKVLMALAAYNEYADSTSLGFEPRENAKLKSLLSDVVIAMREDVFEKSAIATTEYSKLLPIRA